MWLKFDHNQTLDRLISNCAACYTGSTTSSFKFTAATDWIGLSIQLLSVFVFLGMMLGWVLLCLARLIPILAICER